MVTIAMHVTFPYYHTEAEWIEDMVLVSWRWEGMLGSLLLHAGWQHLLFNMGFLWLFGNAVASRIGNIPYLFIYLLCGFAGSVTHLMTSDVGAIGASGAINGIIGFYFLLYPSNRISTFYMFYTRSGTSEIPGKVLIIFWFALDLFGAFFLRSSGTAYWSHVGGFSLGFALGFLFLYYNLTYLDPEDLPPLFGRLFRERAFRRNLVKARLKPDDSILVVVDGRKFPVTWAQLKKHLRRGNLSMNDQVFIQDLDEWQSIEVFAAKNS